MTTAGAEAPARMEAFAAATRDVRALGIRHNDLLSWCRDYWPRLVLPALFSEMFDIPKSEDDDAGDGDRTATVAHVG